MKITLTAEINDAGAVSVTINGITHTGEPGQLLRLSNDKVAIYVVAADESVNVHIDRAQQFAKAPDIETVFLEAGYPAHEEEETCPICDCGGLCAAAATCTALDVAAATEADPYAVAAWMIAEEIFTDEYSATQLADQFMESVEDAKTNEAFYQITKDLTI